jgi:hypothetical protein
MAVASFGYRDSTVLGDVVLHVLLMSAPDEMGRIAAEGFLTEMTGIEVIVHLPGC